MNRYGLALTHNRLSVWSEWKDGTYKMSFPIVRSNPLTYIKPLCLILYRKIAPKRYFKKYPDEKWHLCELCGDIGKEVIGGTNYGKFAVCAACKLKHD